MLPHPEQGYMRVYPFHLAASRTERFNGFVCKGIEHICQAVAIDICHDTTGTADPSIHQHKQSPSLSEAYTSSRLLYKNDFG